MFYFLGGPARVPDAPPAVAAEAPGGTIDGRREVRMAGSGEDVLTSAHVLEYPYSRSVGPVLGAFFTGLREGRILGATASHGVVVPPTEYDPVTAEPTGDLVEVGPGGTVETWAWVGEPAPQHPLDHPFAWALVRLDGAATAMLHVVDAGSPEAMATGMRVEAELLPESERVGRVQDIRAFVPAAPGSPAGGGPGGGAR